MAETQVVTNKPIIAETQVVTNKPVIVPGTEMNYHHSLDHLFSNLFHNDIPLTILVIPLYFVVRSVSTTTIPMHF